MIVDTTLLKVKRILSLKGDNFYSTFCHVNSLCQNGSSCKNCAFFYYTIEDNKKWNGCAYHRYRHCGVQYGEQRKI